MTNGAINCAYYTSGKNCVALFQITEKLIDLINSHHFSTKLFILLYMYAQAIVFYKDKYIFIWNCQWYQSSPPNSCICMQKVHTCAQHKAAQHTQIYTQSRFNSLTQMSGFLVAFRGIKSISAQVTAILQKNPAWNTSNFALIMHPSRRQWHAYAAVPAVSLTSSLRREGKWCVNKCRSSADLSNSSQPKISCPPRNVWQISCFFPIGI